MMATKLWGGRFDESSSDVTERISASVHYDNRLYIQDIRGSKAHAEMLLNAGILSDEDYASIVEGLSAIEGSIEEGNFKFSRTLEDIHMNIESKLTEMIGDAGKRLHTARSRNDQVALDIRLYLRDELKDIDALLVRLISLLADSAEKYIDVIMPGYTHMQIAQPVRLSQHLMAWAWALSRDLRRMRFSYESAGLCPLGVGALAGVNYANDRDFLASALGFDGTTPNSMDTTADRDFALDFLYSASVLGMHLSRFCEELVLWSTAEFSFIRLADGVTTGSSIMPQKRNPDVAELIRGKTGRLYGNLITLLTVMKGLPFTYNRDMQEDKEPLFDSIDTVKLSLEGMIEMLKDVAFNEAVLKKAVYRNFSTATDLADYLVKKGVPFRKSHEIVGNVVRHCEKTGDDFFTLPVETLKGFEPLITDDVREVLDPASSTERKLSKGSTAGKEILIQIASLRAILN
jgi:argininosuccinate lyase